MKRYLFSYCSRTFVKSLFSHLFTSRTRILPQAFDYDVYMFSVCEMPEEQSCDASESLQSPSPLQALLPQEYSRGGHHISKYALLNYIAWLSQNCNASCFLFLLLYYYHVTTHKYNHFLSHFHRSSTIDSRNKVSTVKDMTLCAKCHKVLHGIWNAMMFKI